MTVRRIVVVLQPIPLNPSRSYEKRFLLYGAVGARHECDGVV